MTREFGALGLILLFPLIGVGFNIFFGRRAGRAAVNFVAPALIFLSFGVSVWAFASLLTMPPGAALTQTLWPWIEAGRFHVDIALRFDALTAIMTLVVTGVGAFIHLYSDGYMAEDQDYARFFAYMNLFAFSMLTLVLADNLLLMFVGWEGVGLCSYLLIAFWYDNSEFAYNGRKAFIVNRIGDAGFILGILTLVWALATHGVWTLTFTGMAAHRDLLRGWATMAALLLFLGATGKSAQIPLYVWLPDAMVGPTPVSALIHAATMVTAGVYMIARLNFLYVLSPPAMMTVAVVGVVTFFFRRDHCDCTAGHQARARLFDDQPDRLHDARGRGGRLRRRHFPPDDACILQKPAFSLRGLSNACARRRTGHEPDGWSVAPAADYVADHADRRARNQWHPALCRLLFQGSDTRVHVFQRTSLAVDDRCRHGWIDRVVHVPAALHDVSRCFKSRAGEGRSPA